MYCNECNGLGYYPVGTPAQDEDDFQEEETCESCNGTGNA